MKKWLIIMSAFTLAIASVCAVVLPQKTSAVSAGEFRPGNIIADSIFYDKNAMSIDEIQTFLNRHVPSCDTQGTGSSGHGGLSNAQYAQQIKHWPGPPYVCLNNYYENPNTGETSFEKGGGAFSGGMSAAQIIYDAAQKYNINPQVLLVMLRKESLNLFSDNWPMKSQYKYSMGYACPDSGPNHSANCNNELAGFYKQMMKAAWQLNRYRTHIEEYNYQPGRTNYIQYNPNPSCGGSNVYIENVATASLYIYTPYQPNQAALNAYPGTASCGAYGNRNFWFFFHEWFGDTSQSDIIGDIATGRLYLKSENTKYYIPSLDVLNRLNTLSRRISYVSKQYLDSLKTGPTLNKTVRDPNSGAIYLIDSGYKLQFTSCEMLAHYGLSCTNTPDLENNQLVAYRTGPTMTNYFQTSEDERVYYVASNKRAEIYDQNALEQQGLSGKTNRLSSLALRGIGITKPIVRNDTLVRDAASGAIYYQGQEGASYLNGDMYKSTVFHRLPLKTMLRESVAQLPKTDNNIRGHVKDESGRLYILGASAKYAINTTTITPRVVSASTLAAVPTKPTPRVVKSADAAMVYLYRNDSLYPIHYWSDILKFSPNKEIIELPKSSMAPVTKSTIYIPAATLVKSPNDAAVYMINEEVFTKKRLYSMSISDSMGASTKNIRIMKQEHLDRYKNSGTVSDLLNCGGDLYVAGDGALHYVSGSVLTQYDINGNQFESYDAEVCNNLPKSTPLSSFLISKQKGAIYKIQEGKKRYIGSNRLYKELGGNPSNTVKVTEHVLSMISTGSNV